MGPLEQELVAMKIHRVTNQAGECVPASILPNELIGGCSTITEGLAFMFLAGMPSCYSSLRAPIRPFYPLHIRQLLGGFWYFNAMEEDRSNSK